MLSLADRPLFAPLAPLVAAGAMTEDQGSCERGGGGVLELSDRAGLYDGKQSVAVESKASE